MNNNAPDTQNDYGAISLQLSDLQTQLEAKIQEHSQLLKAADSANWEKSMVERADAVLSEVCALKHKLDELLEFAERQLTKDGYVFPAETEILRDEPARWWKKDLNHTAIPITSGIEDSLESGLDLLIDRLPSSWWKRQQELREAAGYVSLRESVALYGGVSGTPPPSQVHRYAYALMLAQDSMEQRERYDIYGGALLVPFIAALCSLLEPLRAVKGGYEKLDQLRRAPSDETDSRIYEIIVAARCASLGREVEFLDPGANATPDLRIHDFGFPGVVECKMQSRLSNHERLEFETIQRVFRSLTIGRTQWGLVGTLTIISRNPLDESAETTLVEAALRCTQGLNPYQTIEEDWGSMSFAPLKPSVELSSDTPIYSPDFLEQVFDWSVETPQHDGICALIENNQAMIVSHADLPFCLKWTVEHESALSRKARLLASNLSKALSQIPVGEAGFVYLAYEETHRALVADNRTQRFLDMITKWEVRNRGINPQLIVLNRLYPSAICEGRPSLIESAIPTGFAEENVWAGKMPMKVFVGDSI